MRSILLVGVALGLVLVLVGGAVATGTHKTCGQMTAEWAPQPAALADLLAATADHFDAHAAIVAQNGTREARLEADGFKDITTHLRNASKELDAAATAMRSAASWPMVPHDMKKLRSDPASTSAREHKIRALQTAAVELQKEIDFWKKLNLTKPK